MRTRHMAARLGAALLVATLAACAPMVPQTVALRDAWPAGVPQQVELARVPFHPQQDYQCGPASLAMVLQASGADVSPEALVPQVWLPARKGSLQLEMLAAARKHGRVSYRLEPRYADLLREVAAGNPVIVLQDVGLMGTQWHYAVVNGFDYGTGTIYLRSGTEPRLAMPFTAFERTWMKGGYWAMVVTRPETVAATATPERWLESLLAMARAADADSVTRAYQAALARWPDNVAAAIGLANQFHTAGRLDEAASVLRTALQKQPQSVILRNNLAQTVSDQGRHLEALQIIAPAYEDTANPFAAEVRATRQQILERLQSHKAAAVR